MLITVTDKGMAPHEYSTTCKCRGCQAVSKAKSRAALIAAPLVILVAGIVGFIAGPVLGGFTGVVASFLGFGVYSSLSPKSEVLSPDTNDPVDTLGKDQSHNDVVPQFFAMSPVKFIAMSLCTFGIYEVYWSYKNWKVIKDRDQSEILPFWRAVFYALWHYSLLTELNKTLESRALSSGGYRGLLAASVLILNATWRLPDPFWLVSFLTFLGFLPPLLAMRRPEPTGVIQEQTRSFHPSNLIAYLFGGPAFAYVALMSIGFFPSTLVVTGDALWDRDINYLREAELLGPEEEIAYFYSGGLWSIAEDGQFFSKEYVTSYYQDPGTWETYLDYVSFSDISDIDAAWAETFFDMTVVTITTNDGYQFELWLSSEDGGDRKFVNAMTENWNRSRSSD